MNSSFGFDGPGLTPGLGPGNAHNHAETMQRLERLNHLETVTAEQRIRIEKYKTMYETLKAESEQLEDVSFSRHFRYSICIPDDKGISIVVVFKDIVQLCFECF